MFQLNKLIRDQLPNKFKSKGILLFQKELGQEEYVAELKKKLLEEGEEVATSSSKEELIEELADVLEVVRALGEAHGVPFNQIEKERLIKKEERGGFQKKVYCHYVEMTLTEETKRHYEYFRANPDKYPEIK